MLAEKYLGHTNAAVSNTCSAIVSTNFGRSYLSVNTRKTKYILENFLTLIDREVLFFLLQGLLGWSVLNLQTHRNAHNKRKQCKRFSANSQMQFLILIIFLIIGSCIRGLVVKMRHKN